VKRHGAMAIALCVSMLAGCGKSDRQLDKERVIGEAREHAIEDSLAEEREKDRQMREAAAAEATEEVARAVGGAERQPVRPAAAEIQAGILEAQKADAGDALRRYVERLQRFVSDPATLQVRAASLSPKKNAMCAEFSARDKAGVYAGFKRVIVTDNAVNPEEPAYAETMARFREFQAAARDTGCFVDVLNDASAR